MCGVFVEECVFGSEASQVTCNGGGQLCARVRTKKQMRRLCNRLLLTVKWLMTSSTFGIIVYGHMHTGVHSPDDCGRTLRGIRARPLNQLPSTWSREINYVTV